MDDSGSRGGLRDIATALGIVLSPAQEDQLLAYLALLQRWNRTYNLTAIREPAEMVVQHLADCLAILPSLRSELKVDRPAVLDVGSGGGLPGIVLAIAEPAWSMTCVDTVGKKAAFVQQVAVELALPNLISRHGRVESLTGGPQYDLIVSRAFSDLATFTRLSERLLKPPGRWAAMKGKDSSNEAAALSDSVEVFHVEQLRVPKLAAERHLVWMRRGLGE